MIYRRMAGARSEEEIGQLVDEVRDLRPATNRGLNLADSREFGYWPTASAWDDRPRRLDDRVQVPAEDEGRFRPRHGVVQERGDFRLLPPNC